MNANGCCFLHMGEFNDTFAPHALSRLTTFCQCPSAITCHTATTWNGILGGRSTLIPYHHLPLTLRASKIVGISFWAALVHAHSASILRFFIESSVHQDTKGFWVPITQNKRGQIDSYYGFFEGLAVLWLVANQTLLLGRKWFHISLYTMERDTASQSKHQKSHLTKAPYGLTNLSSTWGFSTKPTEVWAIPNTGGEITASSSTFPKYSNELQILSYGRVDHIYSVNRIRARGQTWLTFLNRPSLTTAASDRPVIQDIYVISCHTIEMVGKLF